jgi:C1A family cysteine protease
MLISLRGTQSAVKRQYDRPTCVAFAVTALHEHAYDVLKCSRKTAEVDLSEEFLHYHCKKHDRLGPNSSGTTVAAASTSLAKYGQSLECYCPYQLSLSESSIPAPTGVAYADGKTRLLPGLRCLDQSLTTIHSSLSLGKPLVAVLDWYSNAYIAPSGRIQMPGRNDRFLGRHAVLIVEFDEKEQADLCVITFKNSWGPKWGDNGFGYFGIDYFHAHGRELWGVSS